MRAFVRLICFLPASLVPLVLFANTHVFGEEKIVFGNFAEALLFPSDEKFVAVVESKIYGRESDVPKTKQNFFFTPEHSDFLKGHYWVRLVEIPCAFGKETNGLGFVKMERDSDTIWQSDRQPFTPIMSSTTWLLVLECMFDSSGKFIRNTFDGIEKFSFINKDTFFAIREPHRLNSIGLQVRSKYDPDFKIPDVFTVSNMDLVEDVKTLSVLACGMKNDPLEFLENIKRTMPSLRTDSGKQIAEKMIKIIESKSGAPGAHPN